MIGKLITRVAIKLNRQPDGAEDVVDIRLIEIQEKFYKHQPKYWKLVRAQKEFDKLGHIDVPITVKNGSDGQLVLVDGYTRYIIAKKNHLSRVAICYKK